MPDGTEGRPNPFAPFGAENSAVVPVAPPSFGGGVSTGSAIPLSAEEASAANNIDIAPTPMPNPGQPNLMN